MELVIWWTKLLLMSRLVQAVPTLDVEHAYAHASAALEAADRTSPAELLLAIAYVESRYDATATSRVEGTVRKTGSYPVTTAPHYLRGTLYCGPLLTCAKSWDQCVGMRVLATGYSAGVTELNKWLRDPRVRGNLTRALLGHGCGNTGLKTGQCNRYPDRVLGFMRQLARPEPRVATSRS
jgi:hypothetical protein